MSVPALLTGSLLVAAVLQPDAELETLCEVAVADLSPRRRAEGRELLLVAEDPERIYVRSWPGIARVPDWTDPSPR